MGVKALGALREADLEAPVNPTVAGTQQKGGGPRGSKQVGKQPPRRLRLGRVFKVKRNMRTGNRVSERENSIR